MKQPGSLVNVRGFWTAFVVLAISLGITLGAFWGHRKYTQTREEARFKQSGKAALDHVTAQLNIFVSVMQGVRALFAANDFVNPSELSRYLQLVKVHDLEKDSGLEGIGIIGAVPRQREEEHSAFMRKFYPEYKLHSTSNSEMLYPILHLETLGPNPMEALGWDVSGDPVRALAIRRAQSTGEPAISARTHLFMANEQAGPAGFLVYLPIYARERGTNGTSSQKTNIIGYVFTAYDAQKLWSNLFQNHPATTDVEIYDGLAAIENLLYNHDGLSIGTLPYKPAFAGEMDAEIFGRRWIFSFYTGPQFQSAFERWLPVVLLTLGIVSSFLFFALVLAQARARATAEHLSSELEVIDGALREANAELGRKIAETRKAGEELAASQRLYQSLVQTLPQIIFRKDLEGRFTFGNAAFAELLQSGPIDFLGKTDFDFFSVVLAEKFRADDKRAVETGQIIDTVDVYSKSTGGARYARVVKTPLHDNDGKIVGIQGISWDITDEKEADNRLCAEKERLTVTLRAIRDAVVATDIEQRILLMNAVAEEMCGLSQAQATGIAVDTVFPLREAESRKKLGNDFYLLLQGQTLDVLKPALLVSAQGKEMLVRKHAMATRDASGQITGAVFVYRDVTQELKLEQELLRASKLESVALLAGGIAHDFNNVLTGIVGHLSLLREHPDLPPDVAERLALLEKSGFKARQLTQQLLTFAKGGSPIKQTASIVEVVSESAEFALRGSNIRAEFNFMPELHPVEIDTGQIGQVIQNLVINGKQAMPEGGTIRISGENVKISKRSSVPLPPGNYVRVSVRDSGPGINPEHLARIFDPYFTTKETGSGLGLATAYSIMKRHDGLIMVESEPGKGSTFHLYLPASKVQLPTPKNETTFIVRGGGKVLAMDDEPSIRVLLEAVLKHFGYESTGVADGSEALREYKRAIEEGRPYAAVIMDLTVPGGMGGKETIRELLKIDPRVKAIVSSGYSNDPVLAEYEKYGFVARVEKPYRINEIGKTLSRILESDYQNVGS